MSSKKRSRRGWARSYAVELQYWDGGVAWRGVCGGLGAGDEAITSPLTFAATANCVLYQGATPVFAELRGHAESRSGAGANRITPRTKAMLPVDYAGHPADLEAMLRNRGAPWTDRD